MPVPNFAKLSLRRLGLLLGLLLLRDLGGALRLALRVVRRHAARPLLLRLARRPDALERLGLLVAAALQALRGDQPLHLGRLLLLARLAAHDKVAHVVLLRQVEDLADVGGALRAEAARLVLVSQARDLLLALLDEDEVHRRDLRRHDAAADALALALA